MANQVVLTFAGDTQSFGGAVGDVSKGLDDVGKSAEHAGEGFRRAGEAADEVDTKAMGFRDTLTGVQDTMGGLAALSKGPSFDAFLQLGAGIGDLGSGFYNFLIPALEKTKIATLASAAAGKVAAGASRVWAAAQWVMNASLWASPITWIVAGVLILIGVIVLIAVKTDWFSKAWRASWAWIRSAAESTWNWLKRLPGWIGTAFAAVAGFITAPFRTAFNLVARAWNATIGQLSWTVPDWVPGLGGHSFSAPRLPTFHSGGTVPGPGNREMLAVLRGGETVSTGSGSGAGQPIPIRAGDRLVGALLDQLAAEIGRRGGDPSTLNLRIV